MKVATVFLAFIIGVFGVLGGAAFALGAYQLLVEISKRSGS